VRNTLTGDAKIASLLSLHRRTNQKNMHYTTEEKPMRLLLTGCMLWLAAGAAAGQMMECINANGAKTYAQFCPPGTVKENKLMKSGVGMGPASGSSAPAPAKSLAERDAEFKKRALERQEAEKKAEKAQADAQESERNCLDARSQLRALQDGQRIVRTDPKTGERIVLEDQDRPAEIAGAQKAADAWCNKK
jgi:hypothetical protein